jgi:hypothetical protein
LKRLSIFLSEAFAMSIEHYILGLGSADKLVYKTH